MFRFEAIGTQWEIETDDPIGPRWQQPVLDRIEAFDITYSRFRADSLVSQVATAAEGGCFDFPDDAPALFALFDLYDRLRVATGGAMDPLIGGDLERLGYDAAYSLTPRPESVHAAGRPSWSSDVVRHGASLVTQRPLVIDIGAAGKAISWTSSGHPARRGFDRFVVDAGGDMPRRPRVIGVAELRNRALCASAINRHAWGDGLHHVLDASTGAPVRDVVGR